MNVSSALVANREPPEAVQPRKAPLHYPAVTTESLTALHTSVSDPDVDVSATQELPAAWVIVAFIRMELVGTFARPAARTFHGFHRVDEFLEQLAIVDIGSGYSGCERDTSPIDQQMVLGAGPAPVYRVWAGSLAPLFVGMVAVSTEALDQSIHPPRPSLSRKVFSSRRQTPAFCQSLSLRQHVTPLPHPIAFGSMPHRIPLLRT